MMIKEWIGRTVEVVTSESGVQFEYVALLWGVEPFGVIINGGTRNGTHFIPYNSIVGITLQEE